ncbi:MAG: 2-C-methyl-D-erythritol 2,4-cyclodiphosphate synthase [Candidatus Kapabacteria bacterium]|jgi:2-C-methyl-D-erythritol 2,4-cyclodiphosphate synthase|nr:2-C-methyl-D-erythritol 2,4-cyclodiphosphate synthase [Candidatus Kapabacteria bacterium]
MVGFGYDSHRLAEGESLILGGVKIESKIGTIAHSDGDAVLHALCDALLGAAGLSDIGEHFPDTDPKYKNADSSLFITEAVRMIKEKSLRIINTDISIILERPKLKDYKQAIREGIAELCEIPSERVNIKAKTNEKMGFVGRLEGVAVYCVCEIQALDNKQ